MGQDDLTAIPYEEYDKLMNAYLELEALKAAGVTNWEGYQKVQEFLKIENDKQKT